MSKLKEILATSLIVAMVSSSVMAMEVAKYAVPDFSVLIGNKLYTLDYANDKNDELEITKAVIENVGDIYIKTTGSEWINNSTGKVVAGGIVDKLEVKTFNGAVVETPPSEEGIEGSIIFKAVDFDTNLPLMDSVSRKGEVGRECVGYISVIDGYTFVSADTTFTGKFTSLGQSVTLKYKKLMNVVNVAPTTKVTGLLASLTYKQGDEGFVLVEAADEDKQTTNIRVSLDGVEIVNSKNMCIVMLNTKILGGHIIKINCIDKQGLAGEEQTFTYAVR